MTRAQPLTLGTAGHIDHGKTALVAALTGRDTDRLPGRGAGDGEPLLHVDRAFTIRGAGTVVTGTLWAGAIAPGDRLSCCPPARPCAWAAPCTRTPRIKKPGATPTTGR